MAWKTWGIRWNPDMQYAPDLVCRCGATPFSVKERFQLIVGFDADCVPAHTHGVGIFQCNACSGYFWFHLQYNAIDFIRMNTDRWNPDY